MDVLIAAIQIACALLLLAGMVLSVGIRWVSGDLEAPPTRRLAEVTPIAPQQSPPPPAAEETRKAA